MNLSPILNPRALVTALLLVCATPVAAQNLEWATPVSPSSYGESYGASGMEEPAGDPGLPTDPTPVPIDGGLSLLGAAGAAYAVRRLRAREKASAQEPS